MRLRFLLLSLLIVVGFLFMRSRVPAESIVKASSEKPTSVAVVELFTSEGCSSCPPADTLLGKIHLKQTSAGQLVVGISEHVTYWDRLGWKDPYSADTFTDRQIAYADRLRVAEPYTPQMVLNGRTQFVGSDSSALQKALDNDAHQKQVQVHIVSSTVEKGGMKVKFSISGAGSRPLDVVAVVTDDLDQSNVLRGENSGRSLQHVSVARTLHQVAIIRGDTEQSVHLAINSDVHLGAGHHLVLFAQERNQGAIVGADTLPI
jgi:hypothetical protein